MATSRSDYGHNTPTFNVDSKIRNFADFVDNIPQEAEELKDLERGLNKHEENDVGNISNKTKNKYNKVSHKIDQLSKDEVKDKLRALEGEETFEEVDTDNIDKDYYLGNFNHQKDTNRGRSGTPMDIYRSNQLKKTKGFELLKEALEQLKKEGIKEGEINAVISYYFSRK